MKNTDQMNKDVRRDISVFVALNKYARLDSFVRKLECLNHLNVVSLYSPSIHENAAK
jgi:hypothetical protein